MNGADIPGYTYGTEAVAESPVTPEEFATLEQAAGFEFATLRMLNERDAARVLDMSARASADLAGDVAHQIELQKWIATSSRDDGIPAEALPSRPSSEPSPVRSDLSAAAPTVPAADSAHRHGTRPVGVVPVPVDRAPRHAARFGSGLAVAGEPADRDQARLRQAAGQHAAPAAG